MAKGKIKHWHGITAIVSVALLILALIGGMLNYVKYSFLNREVYAFSGFELMFGHNENNSAFSNFHPLIFLGFLMGIIGTALTVIRFKKLILFKVIAQVLLLSAAVMIFLAPNAVPFSTKLIHDTMSITTPAMGAGCVMTGVAFLLSGVISVTTLVLKSFHKIA